MKSTSICMLIATTFLACMAMVATTSHAEWSTNRFENTPVDLTAATATNIQIVEDGAGGAIILYLQRPEIGTGFYDLLAHRVDHFGNLLWGTPVVILDSEAANQFGEFKAISDGAGGVFIAMTYLSGGFDVVAGQHLNANGSLMWGTGGTFAVTNPTGFGMNGPELVADGAGGFITAWRDQRDYGSTGYDVWAQRFDASGARLWGPGGSAVCQAAFTQQDLTICTDGVGGAYVAWEDFRFNTNYNIYGQRLNDDGTAGWIVNGRQLWSSGDNDINPILTPTGFNSEFILTCEIYNSPAYNIYVGRFTPVGEYFWFMELAPNPGVNQYDSVAIPDGEGGAFVAWEDLRDTGYTGRHIYLQHVGAGGSLMFGTTGTPAGLANGNQYRPALALDGTGGVLVAWEDGRNPNDDIYGQRINATGSRMWIYYGSPICEANFTDERPALVSDGQGGMIVAWEAWRTGYYDDVYAQRVDYHGKLGHPNPTLTAVEDLPQDQGGMVRLDWDRSYLDDFQYTGIGEYTIWRRFVGAAKQAALTGPELKRKAQRLAADTCLEEAVLTEHLKAGWSFVDQVEPYYWEQYSYEAPTYGDSTAAGILWTDFKVVAHASQFVYWESEVVAGYSVDNLAPGMPKTLMATYDNPDGVLDWSPSTVSVPDLAGYRVYRSGTPGFTPSPATFVGSTPDTSFVDASLASGTWYYKVTAEDHHDNESDPSNQAELQVAVSGVGDDLPPAFRVGGAVPNPFNPSTSIHFSLAAGGHTTVEVFDARGRLVRRLVDGSMGVGNHEAVWDGRDDQGRGLPSGVYLAQIKSGVERGLTKMILAK